MPKQKMSDITVRIPSFLVEKLDAIVEGRRTRNWMIDCAIRNYLLSETLVTESENVDFDGAREDLEIALAHPINKLRLWEYMREDVKPLDLNIGDDRGKEGHE